MSERASDDRSSSAAVLAVGQLRSLVHRLAEEAAGFRRRAIQAERKLRSVEERVTVPQPDGGGETRSLTELVSRVEELERENEELRKRLSDAAERTRQLLERTRFLRQQQEQEDPQP